MGITKQSLSGGGGGELELKERLMSGLGGADALELQPRRDTRPDRGPGRRLMINTVLQSPRDYL